jgi:hypothetical protein
MPKSAPAINWRMLAGRARRRFVLGAGSNLVLTGDFDGLLLHMAIAAAN